MHPRNPLPRLIMFVGSSPGAGKSTLSHLLFQQCVMHRIPTQWWYEEDVFVFEPLRRFADQMVRGDPAALSTFQEGVELAVSQWSDSSVVHITDSYLPGFFWLRPLYPADQLQTYARRLWTLLMPLQPLAVYCHADVEVAFQRATEQRGSAWGHGTVDDMKNWQMPQYPEAPLKDERDVVRFWSWLDGEMRGLLDCWPGEVLTLESTMASQGQLTKQLFDHLGIAQLPVPPPPSPQKLQECVGLYTRVEASHEGEPIVVELRGDTLFANLYWPSGSPLVAEGDDFFRLQSTSRTVRFHRVHSGAIDGFAYAVTWQGEEAYAKVR